MHARTGHAGAGMILLVYYYCAAVYSTLQNDRRNRLHFSLFGGALSERGIRTNT